MMLFRPDEALHTMINCLLSEGGDSTFKEEQQSIVV